MTKIPETSSRSPDDLAPPREWLPEVEVARGIAILAVVLYHAIKWGGGFDPSYKALSRFLQFSVPLFFTLSAMVLVRRARETGNPDWRAFFLRRWRQVIVPFLVWTTIYVALMSPKWNTPGAELSPGNLARWYLLGQASPHLWFTPVMVQFYLLLPLLWPALRTRKPSFVATVLVSAAVQAAYCWVDLQFIYAFYPGRTVFTVAANLGLGLWLGLTYEQWAEWWRKWRGPIFLIAVVSGYAFTRPPWVLTYLYLFVGATSLAALALSRDLVARAERRLARPALSGFRLWTASAVSTCCRWLARLGEAAYGVYLVHPLCLRLWFRLWPRDGLILGHTGVWGGFLAATAASWGLFLVTRKTPLHRWLFGGR